MAGKKGAASVPVIDPPKDTEAAKTAPVVRTYTFPGPNLTPAETWSSGHRTPYGLAFAPDGRLWEIEHGPKGGDELNLIEPGKNYGWPLASYATNYNGVPIPSPDTRPDLTKPVIYWTPVIAPGNLIFYNGAMFPQWKGSAPHKRSGAPCRSTALPSMVRAAPSPPNAGMLVTGSARRRSRSRWLAMDARGFYDRRSVPRDAEGTLSRPDRSSQRRRKTPRAHRSIPVVSPGIVSAVFDSCSAWEPHA